jgi:DNA-binding CsgD family transcriptional regulator
VAQFRAGQTIYLCRAYFIESQHHALSRPVIAIVFEKSTSTIDTIDLIAAEFKLTRREQQTLEGISRGLSSKELATQMKISPNTVKAFVHLIITKMGVTTRAEVVAKVLAYLENTSDTARSAESGPVSVLRRRRNQPATLRKYGM